ncbi:zinc finger protein ZAT12-like [Andrographis paniculata]|uniref:zinc finger protein ZAT12-like n=1 Tax=Andrographis paniculata TaxID=175694 RepID=UPI0021E86605|nr:zinc finger protein ZAT12-like [Andrographis paniculata]
MMMKRSREGEYSAEDITAMAANYLVLLSTGGRADQAAYGREFTCKTCNRQFSSFQALGGHRASHKKPRLLAQAGGAPAPAPSPPKPKTHECSICGMEFPIGQALGGHMRRHRAAGGTGDGRKVQAEEDTSLSLSPPPPPPLPVVKTAANNSRRVLCVDLNLTPSENKFVFGKISPAVVDCFF